MRCGPTDFSLDTVFSNDSTMMAVPVGNRIHVYRTEDCSFLHDLGSHFMSVKSLAFSFDDDMLATGSWDGGIMLWDLTSGSLLSSIQGHTGFYHGYFGVDLIISGLAFSPDNRYLASGGFTDGTIRIWGINP